MKKMFQYKKTINFLLRLLLILVIAYAYNSLSNSSYSILTVYFVSFGFILIFYGCFGIDIITLKTEKAGWKYMLITSSIFSFIYLLTIYGGSESSLASIIIMTVLSSFLPSLVSYAIVFIL